MLLKTFCTYCVLIIALFATGRSPGADDLIWPIDSPKSVTSSFGEPRPGRYHYGIDTRSGGMTGKKVFALGDGYISRIKTTPFGYGKVLYLTLDTGKIVVYGHLSGFTPEVEEVLFRRRLERKSYDVELWPKPDDFRFEKGQVIAYSGDTGSGGAHLHFEVRDRNNTPLNPLEHGFKMHDNRPPVIEGVLLIPLDYTSSVDGSPVSQWYDRESLNGKAPTLYGRVGVAVSVWDRINNSRNHLGIYTVSLDLDSTTVFSKQYSKISYALNHSGALDYLSGYRFGKNGSLSVLYRRQGNIADFYDGDGVLKITGHATDEDHSLTITASDYSGNSDKITLPVVFGKHPQITTFGFSDSGTVRIAGTHPSGMLDRIELWRSENGSSWAIDRIIPVQDSHFDVSEKVSVDSSASFRAVLVGVDSLRSAPRVIALDLSAEPDSVKTGITVRPELYHDRIVARITSPSPLATQPVVTFEKNGVVVDGIITPLPLNDTTWIASIPVPRLERNRMRIKAAAHDIYNRPVFDIAPVEFTTAGLNSGETVHSPDSLFTLTVEPSSLYRIAPVAVDAVDVHPQKGLRRVSPGYRISWGDAPLKGASKVRLSLDKEPPKGSALFQSVNGKGWKFMSDTREGNIFTGKIGSSTCVAVLSDILVPYIKPLAPKPGGKINGKRPLLKAFVEDKGSGISGSNSISMSIDSITIYGEYDFEAHTVSYRLKNPLKPGTHTVSVTVKDKVGNEKERSWKFTVR